MKVVRKSEVTVMKKKMMVFYFSVFFPEVFPISFLLRQDPQQARMCQIHTQACHKVEKDTHIHSTHLTNQWEFSNEARG